MQTLEPPLVRLAQRVNILQPAPLLVRTVLLVPIRPALGHQLVHLVLLDAIRHQDQHRVLLVIPATIRLPQGLQPAPNAPQAPIQAPPVAILLVRIVKPGHIPRRRAHLLVHRVRLVPILQLQHLLAHRVPRGPTLRLVLRLARLVLLGPTLLQGRLRAVLAVLVPIHRVVPALAHLALLVRIPRHQRPHVLPVLLEHMLAPRALLPAPLVQLAFTRSLDHHRVHHAQWDLTHHLLVLDHVHSVRLAHILPR